MENNENNQSEINEDSLIPKFKNILEDTDGTRLRTFGTKSHGSILYKKSLDPTKFKNQKLTIRNEKLLRQINFQKLLCF